LDNSIIEHVKSKGVVLEVCPTSNHRIGIVNSIQNHPITALLDKGVKVTVSTDDPGIFHINLPHELNLLQNELNFTPQQLRQCNEWAFDASFIDPAEKNHYKYIKPVKE